MDVLETIRSVVNADHPEEAGLELIVGQLQELYVLSPDKAPFFAGVIWGLFSQLGLGKKANRVLTCLGEMRSDGPTGAN